MMLLLSALLPDISRTDLTLMISISQVCHSYFILQGNWLRCQFIFWWKRFPSLCLDLTWISNTLRMFHESLALARVHLRCRQQTETGKGRPNIEADWMNFGTCQVDKSDFYCEFSQVAAAQVFVLEWGFARHTFTHFGEKKKLKDGAHEEKSSQQLPIIQP